MSSAPMSAAEEDECADSNSRAEAQRHDLEQGRTEQAADEGADVLRLRPHQPDRETPNE